MKKEKINKIIDMIKGYGVLCSNASYSGSAGDSEKVLELMKYMDDVLEEIKEELEKEYIP